MFPMYDTPFHFIVLQASGIQSIAGLAGKRLGVGPQGGTSATYTPALLTEAPARSAFEPRHVGRSDGAAGSKARSTGSRSRRAFPSRPWLSSRPRTRYATSRLTPEQILALRLAIPELNASVIPAGTYPSLMYVYETVGLYNFALAQRDLPASLVYEIVKAVFDHHEEMMEVHPAAASTVPKNFVHNTFLPYHERCHPLLR